MGQLYVDLEEEEYRATRLIESWRENRQQHSESHEKRCKCVRFVHGEQFSASDEEDREEAGLPSLVVDKCLGIYSTLDGWARGNQTYVRFDALGEDDTLDASLYNTVYSSIATATGLASLQAEVYGQAAITDESFLMVYPEKNFLGERDVGLLHLLHGECFPDPNSRNPIYMHDAEFIDVPYYLSARSILKKYRRYLKKKPHLEAMVRNWSGGTDSKNKQGLDESEMRAIGEADHQYGQLCIVTRFWKKCDYRYELVNLETGEQRPADEKEIESGMLNEAVLQKMGFILDEVEEETLMWSVAIPAISEEELIADEPFEFQPMDVNTGKRLWPIVRCPHRWVAGRSIGAIRPMLKLQESRNLIMSALLHHLQTAANGGQYVEKSAIPDPTEKEKNTKHRNRAAITIEVADGALKDGRIGPIHSGNVAFRDAGQIFEEVLLDAMRDTTGAEPVMRGQSQKGAPASLFKQQVDQAQNQMRGSQDYYRDFQYGCATLIMELVRQFWTARRVIEVKGSSGDMQKMVLNQQTAHGIVNDVSRGLFKVRMEQSSNTQSARRQRLADLIEVMQAMAAVGFPSFLLDYEEMVQNLDKPQDVKQKMLAEIAQWKQLNGINVTLGLQNEIAQHQAGIAQAEMQAGAPGAAPAPGGAPGAQQPSFAGTAV